MSERVRLVAGRIGRAHGLRGEVSVAVRTDDAPRRFFVGAEFGTDPDRGLLRIAALRWHQGRLLVGLDGITDREGADDVSGTDLLVDVTDEADVGDDPDAWHVHRLVGCSVVTPDGTALGRVVGVAASSAQDLLVVSYAGRDVLVPFVSAIVPEVDMVNSRIVVDPPGGLFDP